MSRTKKGIDTAGRPICVACCMEYKRPEALEWCSKCGRPLMPGDYVMRCRDCFRWSHYEDSPKCRYDHEDPTP